MPQYVERVGVLGGTFDPVHRAHLAMARAVREYAGLDRVLLTVSARPPHKKKGPFASAEDRLAMVERAVAEEPGIEACGIELERAGPSYTAETLEALRARYPETEWYLVIGADSLVDLPGWYAPERILAAARLLVFPRKGVDLSAVSPMLSGRYEMVPFDEMPISSTGIRARLRAGERCDDVLPGPVAAYIREKGLYDASHAG